MIETTYIIGHLMVSLLVGAITLWKWGKGEAFCETLLVLTLPVFGLCMWLIFHGVQVFYPLMVEKRPILPKPIERLSFGDIPYDEDMIPLRDAFLLDDVHKKRKFFTEAIKQNVVSDEEILLSAIHDEDREMSYYAVSMMTTRMETLENQLIDVEKKLAQQRTIQGLKTYASLLRKYVSHKTFMDRFSFIEKEKKYKETLQTLIQREPEEKESYLYLYKLLMGSKQWNEAEKVCQAYQKHFGMEEKTFLLYIELYEKRRNKDAMMAMIQQMKESPLTLSKEALQVIRYWDRRSQS